MATFALEIAPELEAMLRREAANQGVDVRDYILSTLRERLATMTSAAPPLPATEAALLLEINQGLSAESWQRYSMLKERRRAEALTPKEQAELISFSDQIEELNVQRIERLIQLARLRNVSVDALMDQLGTKSPPYE